MPISHSIFKIMNSNYFIFFYFRIDFCLNVKVILGWAGPQGGTRIEIRINETNNDLELVLRGSSLFAYPIYAGNILVVD